MPPKMTDASVTVIVPTFEEPILLARALTSLRDQTHESLHVLVVNNGGDPSAVNQVVDVIRTSSAALASRISVHHRKSHDTRGALVSDALGHVESEFVAVMDQSQTWMPLCAASALQSLTEHPHAPAVCVGHSVVLEKMIEERVWPRRNTSSLFAEGDMSLTSLLSGYDIPEHAVVYRSGAISEVGGVDTSLEHLAMWDLNVRLATLGTFVALPTSLVTVHVLERTAEQDNEHRHNVEAERHRLMSAWLNESLPGGANKGQAALDALANRNREQQLQQLRDENVALRKEIANFHGISSRALRVILQPKKLVRAFQRRLKK